jgi:hypothetical protein
VVVVDIAVCGWIDAAALALVELGVIVAVEAPLTAAAAEALATNAAAVLAGLFVFAAPATSDAVVPCQTLERRGSTSWAA